MTAATVFAFLDSVCFSRDLATKAAIVQFRGKIDKTRVLRLVEWYYDGC